MSTQSCSEVEPLIVRAADGVLEAEGRVALDAHVNECSACRATLEAGRGVRELLVGRSDALRDRAPEPLRAKVTALAVPSRVVKIPVRLPRPLWRRVALSAAAAVLVAVTGVVAFGALSPSGTVLAAQLTLDHFKCLMLTNLAARTEPGAVEARWRRERGWAIEVPPPSADERLELVALRRCLSAEGEMAHVVYRHAGRSVSLFILPHPEQAAAVLDIMGYQTVAWQRDGRTYALVGDAPRADLQRLGEFMRARAR